MMDILLKHHIISAGLILALSTFYPPLSVHAGGLELSEPLLQETENREKKETLEGILRERKEGAGTLNEYSYYVLESAARNIILFKNTQKKRSDGFQDWKNQHVVVSGYFGTGTVGFRNREEAGFIVEIIH